jgi:hypothetical protein
MLSQFSNEVLSRGPAAVLPQNLNEKWFRRIEKAAGDFLDLTFPEGECRPPAESSDPLLTACVFEIAAHQAGGRPTLSNSDMSEKLAVYAVSVMMEAVSREKNLALEPPDLNNIFSADRIRGYQAQFPAFVNLLQEACIIA